MILSLGNLITDLVQPFNAVSIEKRVTSSRVFRRLKVEFPVFIFNPIGDTKFVIETMGSQCDTDELRNQVNEAAQRGDSVRLWEMTRSWQVSAHGLIKEICVP